MPPCVNELYIAGSEVLGNPLNCSTWLKGSHTVCSYQVYTWLKLSALNRILQFCAYIVNSMHWDSQFFVFILLSGED